MPEYRFVTVDVFTNRRFGGNPLAVFPEAAGLSDAQMQLLAREFNLSETTFVLPPRNPAHTAHVRIFGPKHELPFAGHPNVGTALVLGAAQGGDEMVFEEEAGLVRIALSGSQKSRTATLQAPVPLQLGQEVPAATVAACAGLVAADIGIGVHLPVIASVGLGFAIAQVSPEALARAEPDTGAFRHAMEQHPTRGAGFALLLYAQAGRGTVRARMFAPLAGIPEDPATGSATSALVALLLSRSTEPKLALTVHQGVEMGRPSLLKARAWRDGEAIWASVGGGAVPVMQGVVSL